LHMLGDPSLTLLFLSLVVVIHFSMTNFDVFFLIQENSRMGE
jgi:hypothetical protein